jgi:hypothetical protein
MLQPSVTPNSSSVDSKVPLGPRSDGGFHFSPVFLPKNHDAGMCIAGGEHREHHVAQSTVRRLKRVVFVSVLFFISEKINPHSILEVGHIISTTGLHNRYLTVCYSCRCFCDTPAVNSKKTLRTYNGPDSSHTLGDHKFVQLNIRLNSDISSVRIKYSLI